MKCKRKIMVGIAFVAVVLCILFQSNTFGRKKSELIIEEVDLKNNCIYATAKNQLYDTDDNYIIYGVSGTLGMPARTVLGSSLYPHGPIHGYSWLQTESEQAKCRGIFLSFCRT